MPGQLRAALAASAAGRDCDQRRQVPGGHQAAAAERGRGIQTGAQTGQL